MGHVHVCKFVFVFLLYVVLCTSSCGGGKGNPGSQCSISVNISVVGYAFIYFEDERDAEDAIRRLDNVSFGYDRRRLSVEWSRVISCQWLCLDRYFCHFHFLYEQHFVNLLIATIHFFNLFSKLNQCQRAVIDLLGM